jgi:hypothetical protein
MSFAVAPLFFASTAKKARWVKRVCPTVWRQKSCLKGKSLDGRRAMKLRSPVIVCHQVICLCLNGKSGKMGKTWVCPTVCGGKNVNLHNELENSGCFMRERRGATKLRSPVRVVSDKLGPTKITTIDTFHCVDTTLVALVVTM